MKKRCLFLSIILLCTLPAVFTNAQNRSIQSLYNSGRAAMAAEEWYNAIESFLEALRVNASHAESTAAMAECYYALSEFDEALNWVRKARGLARGDLSLANLEARVLIALGQLNEASRIIGEVLAREPYNRDALFAQAEMDIARGRAGEAVTRYREAARRYPDDQKLLLSLALVLGSLGQHNEAKSYIDRVLAQHSEDYRVYYYAAYLASRGDRIAEGIRNAERALFFKSNFDPAKMLLAKLRYRNGQFEEAARLADEIIAKKRETPEAWYLKGMAFSRLGRRQDAITVLSGASGIAPDDEFIRSALEDLLISGTPVEAEARRRWASWHFSRAKDFRARNLSEQALFEYRRGLRLNPYARERSEYAELLRLQGFPARSMEELRFMQDLGLGNQGIDDLVESFSARLANALFRRWQLDPLLATKRHWKIAVFSVASQSGFYHVDGSAVASAFIKDLLIHERNILPMEAELRQSSFSTAFRAAREGGTDYFVILSVTENERDLSLKAEVFVSRTGSPAAVFSVYRTGPDRLRNAGRNIVEQLNAALPFRSELAARQAGQGLIDKGRADGVTSSNAYDIVKKGRVTVKNDGIGLVYAEGDIVGTITINEADEEVAAGSLNRRGNYDRIETGDEVILQKERQPVPGPQTTVDPELRALLRSLR